MQKLSAIPPLDSNLTRLETGLFITFLAAAGLLLNYPVELTYNISPVQSVAIIPDFAAFSVLFVCWMFIGGFLLLRSDRLGILGIAVVLATIGLVNLWFWIPHAPNGFTTDESAYIAGSRAVQTLGHVPSIPSNFVYYLFPGALLLLSQFSIMTGLGAGLSRDIVMLFLVVALVPSAYLLYRKSSNWKLASIVAIISIIGNRTLITTSYYQGGTISYLFILLVLFLMFKSSRSIRDVSLIALFAGVTALTYLPAAVLIALVGASYSAWPLISETKIRVGGRVPVLLAIFPIAWVLYKTPNLFSSLIQLSSLQINLGSAFQVPTSSAVSGLAPLPLWALVTQLFWLIFVYVGGVAFAVIALIRWRRSTLAQAFLPPIVALFVFTIVTLVAYPTGSQYVRFFQYGSFFLAPMVVVGLSRLARKGERIATGLVLFLIVVSLPTFAVNSKNVAAQTVHLTDTAPYQDIAKYDAGILPVYVLPTFRGTLFYLAPNLEFITSSGPYVTDSRTFAIGISSLVSRFVSTSSQAVFVVSSRDIGELPSVGENAPIKQSLSSLSQSDVVYSDYVATVYFNPG